MIMDDPENNPDFHDWNHVYLPYLSGDLWLGSSEAKVNYARAAPSFFTLPVSGFIL